MSRSSKTDMAILENASGFQISVQDVEAFSGNSTSALQHNYHKHPLLQLDALQELANYLFPLKQCRFVSADLKQDSSFTHYDHSLDGRDIDRVFSEIEEPGTWIALYNIEAHPTYKRLLEQMLDSVDARTRLNQGKLFNIGGFLFISTPPSVTPFHIDRENNFWLQLSGEKKIILFDKNDRSIVPEKEVENFIIYRSLDKVKLDESIEAKGVSYAVNAGEGVYFPSTTPHMTKTEKGKTKVSISLGVVFYTDLTRKIARVHHCNNAMRGIVKEPRFPGQSTFADSLKAPIGHMVARIKQRLRGYNPPPGIL